MTGEGASAAPGDRVRVAVLQVAAEPGAVDANVDRLVRLVQKHGPEADLVVAPELATTGYDLDVLRDRGRELAEPADGPSVRRLAEAAAGSGTTVVAGFLEEEEAGALYDSLVTVSAGRRPSVYRKSHLYPPETVAFAPGHALDVIATPAAVIGPLLCFEHAFPEMATRLALRGAQVLVIPSAVPLGYEHLLELRTRARAQDNQIYAVGCNMAGYGFCGRSLVAGPRGQVLVRAGEEETVLHAELDLSAVHQEREQEPALRLRRPELYGDREA